MMEAYQFYICSYFQDIHNAQTYFCLRGSFGGGVYQPGSCRWLLTMPSPHRSRSALHQHHTHTSLMMWYFICFEYDSMPTTGHRKVLHLTSPASLQRFKPVMPFCSQLLVYFESFIVTPPFKLIKATNLVWCQLFQQTFSCILAIRDFKAIMCIFSAP